VNNAASASACSDASEQVTVSPKGNTGVQANTQPVKPKTTPKPATPTVIHGPGAGCVPSTFSAYVTGADIKQVTFYLNKKKLGVVKKSKNGRYTIQVSSKGLKSGEYRVIARVEKSTGTGSKAKTTNQSATLIFYTCSRSPKPQFTG
jgi:hypothetical protein